MNDFNMPPPRRLEEDPVQHACRRHGVCDVCGLSVEDCSCPRCPVCDEVGRLDCYMPAHKHGMVMSGHQKAINSLVTRVQEFTAREEERVMDPGSAENLLDHIRDVLSNPSSKRRNGKQ